VPSWKSASPTGKIAKGCEVLVIDVKLSSSGDWLGLAVGLIFIVVSLLPVQLRRNGVPEPHPIRARIAAFALGVTILFAWYSSRK